MPEGDDPKTDPPGNGGGDLAALKKALESEREQRKAAEKERNELKASVTELSNKFTALETTSKSNAEKLSAYELGEKRKAALEKAVAAAGDKVTVDRAKAEKLIAKLGNAETLDVDVAEIVATLATPKAAPERKIDGQPENKAGGGDGKSLTQLFKENPDGFKAAVAEGVKKTGFYAN